MNTATRFPPGFLWGAGTSAYQVEGATRIGGRGPSDWDEFVTRPGAIVDGHTADVAADHYHRYPEDLDLARGAGLDVYRFSLSWSRVIPDPDRPPNQVGLDFYSKLLDATLDRGLIPFVTLSHMDVPLWLSQRGGWVSRDSIDRFTEYAQAVMHALGDRVDYWTTLNEIPLTTWNGYATDKFPPGGDRRALGMVAIHHQLLAHGRAVEILRAATSEPRIGIVGSVSMAYPADPADPRDVAATRDVDEVMNRSGTDPLFLGRYSDRLLEIHHGFGGASFVEAGDMDVIGTKIDFYGVNYYTPTYVQHDPTGSGNGNIPAGLAARSIDPAGLDKNSFGWLIEPRALTDAVRRFAVDYRIPVFITENGTAADDVVAADGYVHDDERVTYLADHIAAVADAIDDGVDIRGYFAWSLLDNFEWAAGMSKRFGLVHVDYPTQTRTPKASYHWFREFIEVARKQSAAASTPR